MTSRGALDLAARAAAHPGDVALIDASGARLTWRGLAGRAAAVARHLEDGAVRGGDPRRPIAFVAHARPATFVAVHALIAEGRPFVPVHPRLGAGAAAALCVALGAGPLVDVDALDDACADEGHDGDGGPTRPDPGGAGPRGEVAPAEDERPLAVLATSGTSAAPKGVVLSRRAFAAAAVASGANTPFGRGDRWLACMPLAHAGGLSIVTRALAAGAGVVLLPRFDAAAVLEAVRAHGVTHLSAVPTMLRALLESPGRDGLAALRTLLVGGAACPADLLGEARARGVPALASYGLTEACSQVTTQPLADAARPPEGDSGLPLAGVEIAVRGAGGERLGAEREGEILVRGRTLMTGYRGAVPLAPGAWHPTGDVGVIRSDGRLVVLARRTDLIVTGGENVASAAVDAAFARHDAVHDVVAFGVDDARWGQRVAVVLVLAPGVDPEHVLVAVAGGLPPHARPRLIAAVDGPIPRTSKGEPDRAAARERWRDALRAVPHPGR